MAGQLKLPGWLAWVWPAFPPLAVLCLGEWVFVWVCTGVPYAQLKAPAAWSLPANVVCDPPSAANTFAIATNAASNAAAPYCLTGAQSIAGPESAAQITAWIAWMALVIVCAAVVAVSALILVQLIRARGALVAGLIAAVIATVISYLVGPNHSYVIFGGDIFANTVCSAVGGRADVPLTGDKCVFDAMIYSGAVASTVASVFTVIAICVLSGKGAELKPQAQKAIATNLAAAAATVDLPPEEGATPPVASPPASNPLDGYDDQLKYLLFGVSAVLFLGVFALRAWNSWPEAFYALPKEKLGATAYDQTLQAYVNIQAVTYVFLLLTAFGPVAFGLRRAGAPPSGTTGSGPASLWTESLQKTLALLAPLLAIPINALLTSFTQGWGKLG